MDQSFRKAAEPTLPADAVVQVISQDRQGVLWFGTRLGVARYENGVTRFLTKKDGLAADDIHVILEGANGDLWVGGYSGGLTRIRNGQFDPLDREGWSAQQQHLVNARGQRRRPMDWDLRRRSLPSPECANSRTTR